MTRSVPNAAHEEGSDRRPCRLLASPEARVLLRLLSRSALPGQCRTRDPDGDIRGI